MTIGHNGGPPIDWKQYGGFIVEARASREHPIVGYGQAVKPADPDRKFCLSVNEAWRWLLHEAQYKDGRVNNGGRLMEIRRGELTGAVSWLAQEWNWTPKTVRRFLDKLEADGMISRFAAGPDNSRIETERGNHGGKQAAIISVCNYEKFNPANLYEGQANGQAEGKQGASKGQAEGKSINKETKEQDKLWGKRERTPEEIAEADRIAAEAYALGQAIKGGSVAKSGRSVAVTTGELDGSRGIGFRDGKLTIVNGTAAMFADEFPGLDLAAVCNKAGPEIARQSYPTHEFACSVIRKWAQIQIENKRTEAAPRAKRTTVDVSSALAARFRNGGA